jgi:hypothetical protein
MANFSKIFGLAGVALVFAGTAFGQAVCGTPTVVGLSIIRAEGVTEQVAQLSFTCSTTANTSSVAGSATMQLFTSLPVTSKVINTSSGASEITAQVNGGSNVYATYSSSTISFSSISIPALGNSASFTILVSNIRVNATGLTVSSGQPPSVTVSGFLSGSATAISPSSFSAVNVAFVENGLGTTKLYSSFKTASAAENGQTGFPNGTVSSSGANNPVVCISYSPRIDNINLSSVSTSAGASLLFAVQINEGFASAFKQASGEASLVQASGSTANNYPQNSGTRIQVTFTNIPSAVTLYVPSGAISSQATGNIGVIQATSSAPGTVYSSGVYPAASSSSITGSSNATGLGSAASGLFALSPSSGTATVVFEVITQDLVNIDQYNIPVFQVSSASPTTATTTPIGVSVSFNPISSTVPPSVVPEFAVTSSTVALTGSYFPGCTTSLLFPFVTNQLGFDTGIAIANTSSDPFGTAGAVAQSGTCTMYFYGSGAPSPSNVVTPTVPTATVYAAALSGLAAGFQGYIIAQCNFQYAHGFAFITDGVGASGGLSEGYLAGIIPDTNQVARSANSFAVYATQGKTGLGEVLGN